MSYDLWLNCPTCKRSNEEHLNVTYNFGQYFYEHIDKDLGIRKLYGMTGRDSIPLLDRAISTLSVNCKDESTRSIYSYYEANEFNAREALRALRIVAEKYPESIWGGD